MVTKIIGTHRRLIRGSTTCSWCATRSVTGTTLPSCMTSSVLIIWSAGFASALTGNTSSLLLPLSSPPPLSSLLPLSLLFSPSPPVSSYLFYKQIVLRGGDRRLFLSSTRKPPCQRKRLDKDKEEGEENQLREAGRGPSCSLSCPLHHNYYSCVLKRR